MAKNRVKIVDGFWLDLSKVDAMSLERVERFGRNDKGEIIEQPVFKVVAHCNGGKFILMTDETSLVSTKCEKFILENWVNKE